MSHIVRKSTPRFARFTSLVSIGLVLIEIQRFKNVKINKEMYGIRTLFRQRPDGCTFLCKFWHFQNGCIFWLPMSAKIQLVNFACIFDIRCCNFTICTYICNSTLSFQFLYSNCRFDIDSCFTIQHCSLKYSTFKFTQFNIQV